MKKVLIALIVILIVIQFIKPEKNIHPGPQPNAIATVYSVPADVDTILAKACNDCHSNNTRYPWYNNIQPVAWWLNNHINDGKGEVNFDEFATYTPARQYHKMGDVEEQIRKSEMPLSSYLWIHTDAKLTETEKAALINWADAIRKQLESKYPKDSLETKRPGKPDED